MQPYLVRIGEKGTIVGRHFSGAEALAHLAELSKHEPPPEKPWVAIDPHGSVLAQIEASPPVKKIRQTRAAYSGDTSSDDE